MKHSKRKFAVRRKIWKLDKANIRSYFNFYTKGFKEETSISSDVIGTVWKELWESLQKEAVNGNGMKWNEI